MSERCILCGAALPPDRRWRLVRLMAPRFPRCEPPGAACYRGLARRLGANPTDEGVAAAVAKAKRR